VAALSIREEVVDAPAESVPVEVAASSFPGELSVEEDAISGEVLAEEVNSEEDTLADGRAEQAEKASRDATIREAGTPNMSLFALINLLDSRSPDFRPLLIVTMLLLPTTSTRLVLAVLTKTESSLHLRQISLKMHSLYFRKGS